MADEQLLVKLDDFDPQVRAEALEGLAGRMISGPSNENVNMHFHSFFSYNAEGWSPYHIAFEAKRAGLYAAGLCDFDVLDGQEEFLNAGELLGLRSTVNVETRVFLPEYADREISSPGEPGVTYIMGAGFARPLPEGSPQSIGLKGYRDRATQRNIQLIDRINPNVPDIALDYASDVLPLTPLGGATERHIMRAYVNKAQERFGNDRDVASYWAGLMGKPVEDVEKILGTPAIEEAVRSKLAKRGGFGYVQPSADTFPMVQEFIDWVLSCEAIPMVTWLDGTSDGEQDGRAMLECLTAKGCAALNIVPDRNWNYKDPEQKATKVANLEAIVQAADDMGLPINVGTEMNKAGLPFVDDLSGEVLSRFKQSFLRGARIMVGHSIMLRYAGISYVTCDCGLQKKNDCLEKIGALPPLTREVAAKLREAGEDKAHDVVQDAVKRGSW
ncbi:MAG: hypothetical protein ACYC63_03035 [Armatimonadota bacterium]